MLVSVVIVNYNVRDLLIDAVASLRVALERIDSEIFVVDNASSDGAVEMLAERYPEVVTIPLEANLGFGAANNIAIERARGEYILLINPDTVVEEKTVRTMLRFMEEHPKAAFAGCRVILPDGSLDAAAKRGFPSPWSSFCKVFGISRLFPKSKLFGGYNLTYVGDDMTAKVDAICGCFMFCRAAVLRDLRGFDTDFFMYGEDLDLCYRATLAGHEIYYHPETTIIHIKGESTRRSSIDALAVFYEAMEIFARKHFRGNRLLLVLVHAGIMLRRLVARFDERFPDWWFVFVDVAATLAGFMIGSALKFGSPFYYLPWTFPTEVVVPPLIFAVMIASAGGYRLSDRALRNTAMGYLLGFFVLSALTYFFKEYAFSRGVFLVMTALGVTIGVISRFVLLLYRRIYGAESFRRVAFFGRREIDADMRNAARRLFLGRPVTIVGGIAPTFSELDRLHDAHLGTVENIAKIVRQHRLTDIIVHDPTLGYSEVMQAIGLSSSQPVRFHIAQRSLEASSAHVSAHASVPVVQPQPAAPKARGSSRPGKRLRDRLIALFLLLLIAPVVYLIGRGGIMRSRQLWEVLKGERPLVGGGPSPPGAGRDAIFTISELCQGEPLSQREIAQLEDYYMANQSFLLDCEIMVTAVRLRNMTSGLAVVAGRPRVRTGAQ